MTARALLVALTLCCVGCMSDESLARVRARRDALEAAYKAAADACIKAGGVPIYCTFCDFARMTECQK